jgi:hypothetical protein
VYPGPAWSGLRSHRWGSGGGSVRARSEREHGLDGTALVQGPAGSHRDDPLRAELPHGQDHEQADRAVADDRDGPAWAGLGGDHAEPSGAQHVRGGKQVGDQGGVGACRAGGRGCRLRAVTRALFAPPCSTAGRRSSAADPTSPRYFFLEPGSRDLLDDWDTGARITVALLRAEAGFLTLTYQPLDLPVSAHEAHALTLCTAEPGTAYEERLNPRQLGGDRSRGGGPRR